MKCEFVFCLDMSDSMAGLKFNQARQALIVVLHSLPETCYFNIIVYGQTCSVMQPFKCLPYNAEALALAMAFLDNVEANMGELRDQVCLKTAFTDLKLQTTHRRQILLITDGDFMNIEEVHKFVKSQANGGRGRLFCLGIGRTLN